MPFLIATLFKALPLRAIKDRFWKKLLRKINLNFRAGFHSNKIIEPIAPLQTRPHQSFSENCFIPLIEFEHLHFVELAALPLLEAVRLTLHS